MHSAPRPKQVKVEPQFPPTPHVVCHHCLISDPMELVLKLPHAKCPIPDDLGPVRRITTDQGVLIYRLPREWKLDFVTGQGKKKSICPDCSRPDKPKLARGRPVIRSVPEKFQIVVDREGAKIIASVPEEEDQFDELLDTPEIGDLIAYQFDREEVTGKITQFDSSGTLPGVRESRVKIFYPKTYRIVRKWHQDE